MGSNNYNACIFIEKIYELRNFFKNTIQTYLEEDTDIKFSRKTNILDGLVYMFLNTRKYCTNLANANILSIFKNNIIKRQSFDKRCSKISIDNINYMISAFYEKYLKNLSNDQYFNHTDGTSINIYDPDSKLGYKSIKIINIVNNSTLPCEIYVNKHIQNSEIALFYDYINNNSTYDKTKTFVFDRLYFSDKLADILIKKNLNFICRLKSDSKYLFPYKITKKTKNIKDDYIVTTNNKNKLRIVIYTINNKKYYIATNLLDNKYNIKYFRDAYKKRWFYLEKYLLK